jgi:hypothetical protein
LPVTVLWRLTNPFGQIEQFQSQFALSGNKPSATGSTSATHSTWLRSYKHNGIAPEILPIGNSSLRWERIKQKTKKTCNLFIQV